MQNLNKPRILFVDDERAILHALERITKKLDAVILTASSGQAALDIINECPVDVIVSDFNMPNMDGNQLLQQVAKISPETVRMVLTAHGDMEMIVNLINNGHIWGFLQKPWDNFDLIVKLKQALQLQQVLAERTLMRRTIDQYQKYHKSNFEGFIGDSVAMQFVYSCIEQSAPSNASVFITGPSGAGKEVAAQAIHRLSKKKNGPFIALNCAAIPSELMESEVFGHIKGAFSGAVSNRDGAASLANGGSLFLDEIGEMDIGLQAKLLRFIQTGCFQKVGSGKEEKVDIRFISATNREPQMAINEKKLREDLFYRLNVISIDLPALNERDNDILKLAEHFLSHFSEIEGKVFAGFSSGAEALIKSYSWPGNVRQLQNIVHSSTVMSEGPLISEKIIVQQLGRQSKQPEPKRYTQKESSNPPITQHNQNTNVHPVNHSSPSPSPSIITLAEVERQTIEQAIELCQDNIVKAASELGVSPSTLYRKIQQWQTSPVD
ncbi:sigma-54-dependent transcriptional regulator [Colwellia sp. 12G3]|uniref:sigma-54-dependent transcriptional regulator n=1 Tax=Colwellia sp. 12G3 TaxID=2058299 RepID=UPI000C34C064|nr:sigma-54 dependent transcriptional regulator [Colwellia sp. 12G3]PKI18161.1 sigma-54-dependent Fis family transcriptional regulator [Colwellia sp. 12G3]